MPKITTAVLIAIIHLASFDVSSQNILATKAKMQLLNALKRQSRVRDSINQISIDRFKSGLRVNRKLHQREIRFKTFTRRYQALINISVVLTLGTSILIGVVFSVYSKHKFTIASKIALAKRENDLIQAEIELVSAAEKRTREELLLKAKELTTFTLALIQKNEMLSSIAKEINEIKKEADEDVHLKLTKLSTKISMSIHGTKNWEYFRLYFERINTDFFQRISSEFPGLNGNDLKLCALLKLNLETKEIAGIMEISPESAKVAKHRLRKKIGISPEQDFSSFFQKYDKEGLDLKEIPAQFVAN